MKISAKKAAAMPQSLLDQHLTSHVEQGLEDSANYQVLWAEHQSRTKDQQEAMTAKEFGGTDGYVH